MFFWFQNFFNLAIFIVKKVGNLMIFKKKCKQQHKKTCQKIGIKTLKEKMLLQ